MAHKYHAVPTEIDGVHFASKKEAKRYEELKLLVRAKQISGLELQPRYPLSVNGHPICTYVGDFEYTDAKTGKRIAEDSKGVRTRDYIIKSKLARVLYPHIEFREV